MDSASNSNINKTHGLEKICSSRLARTLYIGSIPLGITNELMMSFFNFNLKFSCLSVVEGSPVVSCYINTDKHCAFVEFRSIQETTQALALDGIDLWDNTLEIRRPKEYLQKQRTEDTQDYIVPGVISTIVPDSSDKIFVGELPKNLSEIKVREILSACGHLKSFQLVTDSKTGMSQGSAFCEYWNSEITDMVCEVLNGILIGSHRLRVEKAGQGTDPQTQGTNRTLQTLGTPTEVLCLLNIVLPEEVDDDNRYQNLIDSVTTECQKYGTVANVVIPRNIPGNEMPGVGKVFVEYSSAQDSLVAHNALTGQQFNNRTIATSFFNLQKYQRQEF